jgi:hypothetical protein
MNPDPHGGEAAARECASSEIRNTSAVAKSLAETSPRKLPTSGNSERRSSNDWKKPRQNFQPCLAVAEGEGGWLEE